MLILMAIAIAVIMKVPTISAIILEIIMIIMVEMPI